MMNILEVIQKSGLNSFFYTQDNLVYGYSDKKNSFIIALNLNIQELGYINDNLDKFILILEKILFIFNGICEINFKNVTFNNIKFGNEMVNNCVFLYNSKIDKEGYIKPKGIIEFPGNEQNKKIHLYDKILNLAETNKLSVRKLMKLGLNQSRARKLYKYLKDKRVIIISEKDNTDKKYDIKKLKKLLKR